MGVKKRKICRLIKRMIKNFILVVITIFAFLMFLASTGALVTESPKALIVFVLSAAWIVLFAHANGWLEDEESNKKSASDGNP